MLKYSDFFSAARDGFDDWTPALTALHAARAYYDENDAVEELGKHLRSGVIRAQSKRAFVCWSTYSAAGKMDLQNAEKKILSASFINGGRYIFDYCPLKPSLWGPFETERSWHGAIGFLDDAHWSDWKRGEFAEISTKFAEGDDDFIYCLRAFGVEFFSPDIEAVFPLTTQPIFNGGRPEKYDWARAFASVSGRQLKEDFLPDLYAQGAQASLANALASFFQLRLGEEPSPTALKDKAKLLLSEWQMADKK